MTSPFFATRIRISKFDAYLKAHGYNLNTPPLWVRQYGWKEASRMQDEVESIDYEIEIDPEDGRSNHLLFPQFTTHSTSLLT